VKESNLSEGKRKERRSKPRTLDRIIAENISTKVNRQRSWRRLPLHQKWVSWLTDEEFFDIRKLPAPPKGVPHMRSFTIGGRQTNREEWREENDRGAFECIPVEKKWFAKDTRTRKKGCTRILGGQEGQSKPNHHTTKGGSRTGRLDLLLSSRISLARNQR